MTDVSRYRVEVLLRSGTPAVVRAIRPDDKEALRWGFNHLSPEAIYHRFFQAKRGLTDADLHYLTEIDFVRHVGLVLEIEVHGAWRIIGVARFVRPADRDMTDRAEIAFTVGDTYQGRGVATNLLRHLAVIARGLGYRLFEAEVLPDNQAMLQVFRHSGLRLTESIFAGVVHVELLLGSAADGHP